MERARKLGQPLTLQLWNSLGPFTAPTEEGVAQAMAEMATMGAESETVH
jgi:hypothetical protein